MFKKWIFLGFLASSPSLMGCAATIARAKIVNAQTAVSAAKTAGADQKAMYEYTSAVLYLAKAREEESYARYGAAIELGDASEVFAQKARTTAAAAANDAQPDASKSAHITP